jgi:hypothetical protein
MKYKTCDTLLAEYKNAGTLADGPQDILMLLREHPLLGCEEQKRMLVALERAKML